MVARRALGGTLGAALLFSLLAAASAFKLPFLNLRANSRRLQAADAEKSDWRTALHPIVADTIGEWTTKYSQFDAHDVKAMVHVISAILRKEYGGIFRWSVWIFTTDTNEFHYGGGDEEHFGIATIDTCDREVVRGCDEEGSMSQIDQNTDHGKHSWVVMWNSAAKPLIADRNKALAFHHQAHKECSESNYLFGIALSNHAKCIMDKTKAAGVLVFPVLADPTEDSGDFDASELIMFQSDTIDQQHAGHENKFNVRILPASSWFSTVPAGKAPTEGPPAKAPEAAEVPGPSESLDSRLGEGCTPFYNQKNCSLCIIKEDGFTPQCLSCEPCYTLDATKTNCVYSKEHCMHFPPLAPAPAPLPDIGEGCNPFYHEGQCSLCIIAEETYEPQCLACEPCFDFEDERNLTCVPSEKTCLHFHPMTPAPAPGPGYDIGPGCDPFYNGGNCSYCLLDEETKIAACHLCEPCYALDDTNTTCVRDESTCMHFGHGTVPALAPGPDDGIGDGCNPLYNRGNCSLCIIHGPQKTPICLECEPCFKATDDRTECVYAEEHCHDYDLGPDAADAEAPSPDYDDEDDEPSDAPLDLAALGPMGGDLDLFKPGEGCDLFYPKGCSYCEIKNKKARCTWCEKGFTLMREGNCEWTGAAGPGRQLGLPLAPLPMDDYADEDDGASTRSGGLYALPPLEQGHLPPFERIPPGKGCTKHYRTGCSYCYYNFTQHIALCDDCMTDYIMGADGTCKFAGRRPIIDGRPGSSAQGPPLIQLPEGPAQNPPFGWDSFAAVDGPMEAAAPADSLPSDVETPSNALPSADEVAEGPESDAAKAPDGTQPLVDLASGPSTNTKGSFN